MYVYVCMCVCVSVFVCACVYVCVGVSKWAIHARWRGIKDNPALKGMQRFALQTECTLCVWGDRRRRRRCGPTAVATAVPLEQRLHQLQRLRGQCLHPRPCACSACVYICMCV
jgi:hypothetical protein